MPSGYPVALLAKAEDRESLALISIAQYSSEDGFNPNWILHSPTILQYAVARMARDRNIWYSKLFNVCDGAMTMLSPVWTRIARIFSMLQTVTLFPWLSRITYILFVSNDQRIFLIALDVLGSWIVLVEQFLAVHIHYMRHHLLFHQEYRLL